MVPIMVFVRLFIPSGFNSCMTNIVRLMFLYKFDVLMEEHKNSYLCKKNPDSMETNQHKEIKVLSVNISEQKGTIKKPVDAICLGLLGIQHDAHAGDWNRQVSLLGIESIGKFEKLMGRKIAYGEFAENITTQGMTLYQLHPLDRFIFDEVEIEVTQIGKECHGKSCQIFQEVGNCVMPKEGIFARVVKKGRIMAGEKGRLITKVFKIKVITLSDRASRGEYMDLSGPEIKASITEFLTELGWDHEIETVIIPDDPMILATTLEVMKEQGYDFLFTTGGTGIGPRDVTPDIVRKYLDKEIPGVMELIRVKYGMNLPNALLSRGVAGMMGSTLVFTLPGSVKAVKEYLEEIFKVLEHAVYMVRGIDLHKAQRHREV